MGVFTSVLTGSLQGIAERPLPCNYNVIQQISALSRRKRGFKSRRGRQFNRLQEKCLDPTKSRRSGHTMRSTHNSRLVGKPYLRFTTRYLAREGQLVKTQAVRAESESAVKTTLLEPALVPNPTM